MKIKKLDLFNENRKIRFGGRPRDNGSRRSEPRCRSVTRSTPEGHARAELSIPEGHIVMGLAVGWWRRPEVDEHP